MAGTKTTNGLIRGLIDAIKERCPTLFQLCPYVGHYEIINVTLNRNVLSVYPAGTFLAETVVTDDVTKATAKASLYLEIIN